MKKFTYGMAALVLFLGLTFVGCNNPAAISDLLNGNNPGGTGDSSGPTGIVINSSHVTTVYTVGDSLDLSGLKVTVGSTNYNTDNLVESAVNAGLLSISPTKLTTPGFQDVTVSVTGVGAAGYKIFVNSDTENVSSDYTYSLSGDESTGYKLGITDKNGGPTVSVNLPDDSTGFAVTADDNGDITVTPSKTDDNGTPGYDPIPIPKKLTGISVTTLPNKTTYLVNDQLNLTGLVVTANYNYGAPKVVADYTATLADGLTSADGVTLSTVGTTTVTVSYGEQTASFNVTVYPDDQSEPVLTEITVTPPTITNYFAGDTLKLAGLVVTANYDNGDSKPVTGYSTDPVEGATLGTAGTAIVTVSYTEKDVTQTDSFTVTVSAVELTGIIVTPPAITNYLVGDKLKLAGLAVMATYNNGNSEQVTGYSTDLADGAILRLVDTKVTVTYTENGVTKTAAFNITVNTDPSAPRYEVTLTKNRLYQVDNLRDFLVITVSTDGEEPQVLSKSDWDDTLDTSAYKAGSATTETFTVFYNGQASELTVYHLTAPVVVSYAGSGNGSNYKINSVTVTETWSDDTVNPVSYTKSGLSLGVSSVSQIVVDVPPYTVTFSIKGNAVTGSTAVLGVH